ncbi:MAG: hypothetical protein ACRYGG_20270 [Janthinobacterium lividum]
MSTVNFKLYQTKDTKDMFEYMGVSESDFEKADEFLAYKTFGLHSDFKTFKYVHEYMEFRRQFAAPLKGDQRGLPDTFPENMSEWLKGIEVQEIINGEQLGNTCWTWMEYLGEYRVKKICYHFGMRPKEELYIQYIVSMYCTIFTNLYTSPSNPLMGNESKECCVCYEMTKMITICNHSLCETCSKKIHKRCPMCRKMLENFGLGRDWALKVLFDKLHFIPKIPKY